MKLYLTGKQAQSVDIFTQNKIGIPGLVLMEKAAEKLAEEIDIFLHKSFNYEHSINKDNIKILAVAESGNNGGDAIAAARILNSKAYGYDTYIYEINGISSKSDSYIKQVEIARNLGVTFISHTESEASDSAGEMDIFSGFDIIIDGIFGVGLCRPVKGVQKQIIDRINYAREHSLRPMGTTVFGVDIPSGISSTSGYVLGTAVECDMTVTFQYVKLGMLINDGRDKSGKIICRDIGLYDINIDLDSEVAEACENTHNNAKLENILGAENGNYYFGYEEEDISLIRPTRVAGSNKGTYGKVLIIAGSKDIYGALYLSASASYAAGAGLVKVVTDIRNRDVLTEKLPESMLLTYDTDELESFSASEISEDTGNGFFKKLGDSVKWADVILIGPGLGTSEVSELILRTSFKECRKAQKIVLDADALNIISRDSSLQILSDAAKVCGPNNVIITPHILEMKRLITALRKEEISVESIKEDPAGIAQEMSDTFGIITVLKDARSVVTYLNNEPQDNHNNIMMHPVYLNTTGNSGMSKGGSGDVLAGIIAGNLAQLKNKSKESVANEMNVLSRSISTEGLDIYKNVCMSVYLHGRAGDKVAKQKGQYAMLASDLIENI